MSAILLTGAAGFIGSHVMGEILARGDTVAGVDCFNPFQPRPLKERNLAVAAGHPRFNLVDADIRDGSAIHEVFEMHRPQPVIHPNPPRFS